MEHMQIHCWMYGPAGESGTGFWYRDVTFPFAPFPGLLVGPHVVRLVFVCQGDLDGAGDMEVQFEDTAIPPGILEGQGWRWEET